MKFRYVCIAGIIIGQAIGIAMGYNDDPSFYGTVSGWLGSCMILLAIAANMAIIALIVED